LISIEQKPGIEQSGTDVGERDADLDDHVEKVEAIDVGNAGSSNAVEGSPVRHRDEHVVVTGIGDAGTEAAQGRPRNAIGAVGAIADVKIEA